MRNLDTEEFEMSRAAEFSNQLTIHATEQNAELYYSRVTGLVETVFNESLLPHRCTACGNAGSVSHTLKFLGWLSPFFWYTVIGIPVLFLAACPGSGLQAWPVASEISKFSDSGLFDHRCS